MTKAICSIDGCDKPVNCRKLCGMHYWRLRTYGDPMHKRPKVVRTCSVDGCKDEVVGRGLCNKHYLRLMNHGTTDKLKAGDRATSLEDAFLKYAGEPNSQGCIEWQGARVTAGYPRFRRAGNDYLMHRYAWERVNGPIPEGLLVRHKCDNPPCVNIDHLDTGTNADNSQDAVERDRMRKGQRHTNAKLTDDEVLEIYRLRGSIPIPRLAKKYGVSVAAIGFIHTGRNWGWLTGAR